MESLTNPLLKAADIPALVERLLLKTNVISFAVSLGGVESIISYPARMSHAAMPSHEREARGVTDTLVRLSVGLEDAEDLIAELDRVINMVE